MYSCYRRNSTKYGTLYVPPSAKQETDPLLLKKRVLKYTQPLPQSKSEEKDTSFLAQCRRKLPEVEQDLLWAYYIGYAIRNIQNWFKERSSLTRSILILLVVYMLSLLMNTLIQVVFLSMGPVYTILGIISSAVVIYESFLKKEQKRR